MTDGCSLLRVVQESRLLQYSGFTNSNKDSKATVIICLKLAKVGEKMGEGHSRSGIEVTDSTFTHSPFSRTQPHSSLKCMRGWKCSLTESRMTRTQLCWVNSLPVSATLILETSEMLPNLWIG